MHVFFAHANWTSLFYINTEKINKLYQICHNFRKKVLPILVYLTSFGPNLLRRYFSLRCTL